MLKARKWLAVVAAVMSLSLIAAACGGDDDEGGETGATGATGETGVAEGLSGTLVISGSSTVQPISSLVAELFNEVNPDVAISVDGPGTGDGFELFCAGETDINDASRQIDEEEVAACEEAGIGYIELEIGLDGVTVMTNPANGDVVCLNNGDLYALFGPQSEGIDTWSGADSLAKEVGGNGGFPDAPLDITAPGEESGTYDAFIDLSGIEDIAIEQGVPEDEAAALRPDYQSSPNDNVIIQAMEGSPSSLGFVGFAFAEAAGEGVKEIEIDGGDGCVAPTAEAIADGSYPLSRSLYIYVNAAKATENPALAAFVDFYLSADGLQTAVTETGYVTLPADRQTASADVWASSV